MAQAGIGLFGWVKLSSPSPFIPPLSRVRTKIHHAENTRQNFSSVLSALFCDRLIYDITITYTSTSSKLRTATLPTVACHHDEYHLCLLQPQYYLAEPWPDGLVEDRRGFCDQQIGSSTVEVAFTIECNL